MERIFGWVRAQNVDLAVDKWKLAEVTRRPEDDGQRDEILAFYRQLVISTSATQVVNDFSIAVYEHAVAAAVYVLAVLTHARTRARAAAAVLGARAGFGSHSSFDTAGVAAPHHRSSYSHRGGVGSGCWRTGRCFFHTCAGCLTSSTHSYVSRRGMIKHQLVSVSEHERMSSSVCCYCSSHAAVARAIQRSRPLRSLGNCAQCHASSYTARRCATVYESGKQYGPATTAHTSPRWFGRQQRVCNGPFWSSEQSSFYERRQCGECRRPTTCCRLILSCSR